ncbi:sortase [Candidatus Dojkabacteria bacterium]|nr:sortase [Candidatus Dojkabacteria bacterium]
MSRKKDTIKALFERKFQCIRELREKIKNRVQKDKRVRVSLKVLLGIMFVVGLYLVFYPFIPEIQYWLLNKDREIYPYLTNLQEQQVDEGDFGGKEIPDENRIVVPAIGVDMPIVEGGSENILNLGVWHRPGTGTPGNNNMVLTGHRVGYAFLPEDIRNSTSFYNLDKLEIGDFVIIYWQKIEYDYEIYDFEIVDRTETSIEGQDGEERLTLYTCHPIGRNDQRLVYYARRIGVEGNE